MMGILEAIWIKRAKGGPMDPVEHAELVQQKGIISNANQRGRRQVTIIELETWERLMHVLNADLNPSTRRANFMISGLSLLNSRGKILKIGECRIKINGETKPCEQMETALPGLLKQMWPNWQGGAFGEILNDGSVSKGDAVSWEK
ncbi:MAG: sulfurase [Calditrichae bacterium]|nr:sulfurase [Calditrichia bacterium]